MTRRTVVGGIIGAGILAAAGITSVNLLTTSHGGLLVAPLLAKRHFTIAHRGGSADWPEISMEAYKRSVALGVDALEMSLARTSDGVWFGLHDATLDRTSGTSDFVASEHTWKEIRQFRIKGVGTTDPNQPPQRYLEFKDLVAAYGATHTIFVDPKAVSPDYFPELFALMKSGVDNPRQTFVAKGYYNSATWAAAARDHGYKSWGYYYGSEMATDETMLSSTQQQWDLLGLDYSAHAESWQQLLSYKKLSIAHVLPTRAAVTVAESKGADGLMISGVEEVLAKA